MKNYLRAARLDLRGDYFNSVLASMIYFIMITAIWRLSGLVGDVIIRCIVIALVSAVVVVPVTYGYVFYFKNHENCQFPKLKILYHMNKTCIKVIEAVLCIGGALAFLLAVLFIAGIQIMTHIDPQARFTVAVIIALIWIVVAFWTLVRFWPLYYLANYKEKMSFSYYLKTSFKLTKGRFFQYIRLHLRFWRLFLLCIIPLGLGLLVFFPILTVAKVKYFEDLMEEFEPKAKENQETEKKTEKNSK